MPKQNDQQLWEEMANVKMNSYLDTDWDKIIYWCTVKRDNITHLAEEGLIIIKEETRPAIRKQDFCWVLPSKEVWLKHIKPLIKEATCQRFPRIQKK